MKKNWQTTSIYVAIGISISVVNAQAQSNQGGVAGLLRGIGNVLNAVVPPPTDGVAGKQVEAGVQDIDLHAAPQIMDILRIEASKLDPTGNRRCTEDYFTNEKNRWVIGQFQRAEYSMAVPSADRIAGSMARCALKEPFNLAQWSNQVGQMLAISAIASKMAGLAGSSQVSSTADRAIALLRFAERSNIDGAAQMLDKLKEHGFTAPQGETAEPVPRKKVALASSTAVIASQFKANRLAFHKNYSGEMLQVTGPVRGVFERTGNHPGANVILTGIAKNPNDTALSDEIQCEISDSKGVSAAANLKRGQSIVASGLYDPARNRSMGIDMESQVVLYECQIR